MAHKHIQSTELDPFGGIALRPTGTVIQELEPYVESEVKLLLQGDSLNLLRRLYSGDTTMSLLTQHYVKRSEAARFTKDFGVIPGELEQILSRMVFKRFRARETRPIERGRGVGLPTYVAQSKMTVFGGLVQPGVFRPIKLELGADISKILYKQVRKNSVGSLRKLRFSVPLRGSDLKLEIDYLFGSGEDLSCNKILVTADLEFPLDQSIEAYTMLGRVNETTGAQFNLVAPDSRLHHAIANYGIARNGLDESYKRLSNAHYYTVPKVQQADIRRCLKSICQHGGL